MRKFPFPLLVAFAAFAQLKTAAQPAPGAQVDPCTLLWYTHPAARWEEALPLGNGHIGAMVFGNPLREQVQLNEATYWTGGPYSTAVPGGDSVLPEVRRLVFEGKFLEAHNLFGRSLMGYPVEQQKYQSLGNILLECPKDSVTGYTRWLDLATATSGTRYTAGGVTYLREAFISYPDNVLVIRITANRAGSISFKAYLHGERNQTHSDYATDYFRMDPGGPGELVLTGKSADYMSIKGRLRYEARLKAVLSGGSVRTSDDGGLVVTGADTVTLYLAAATNFVNYKDVSGDAHARVAATFAGLQGRTYGQIREDAIRDYRSLFDRITLKLPVAQGSYAPTDERMQAADPALAALSYQFGRYIMISCSRPGCQPANLQGMWNKDMNPWWDSKYTTNINTEMNYWPVESTNLPECAEPLIQLVRDVTEDGARVAKEHYGCRGWVLHQNTDLWRVAAPMDGPTWGTFTVGGAWLCTQLWDHYLFHPDSAYLDSIYPILRGSVLFFTDFLVPQPNGKWLVTNPSMSPENFPGRPGNGPYFDEVTGSILPGTTICAGSSIDMQILADLFSDFHGAAHALGRNDTLVVLADSMATRFPPPQQGKDGLLQEWTDDWAQLEPQHRHLSPLYGLYPGNRFSPLRTPEWMGAIRNTLAERGDGGPGWSRAWKMDLWARLRDGDHVWSIYKGYLKAQCWPQMFAKGGIALQVDGTFGVTAAVSEMLLQSNEGALDLLPALPTAWSEGSISGICGRGGYTLALSWAQHRLTRADVSATQSGICRVRAAVPLRLAALGAGGVRIHGVRLHHNADGTIEFPVQAGKTYTLISDASLN